MEKARPPPGLTLADMYAPVFPLVYPPHDWPWECHTVQPRGAAEGVTEGVGVPEGVTLGVGGGAPVEGLGLGVDVGVGVLPAPLRKVHDTALMRWFAVSATKNTPEALGELRPWGPLKEAENPRPSCTSPPPARAIVPPPVLNARRREVAVSATSSPTAPPMPPHASPPEGLNPKQALGPVPSIVADKPHPARVDTARLL